MKTNSKELLQELEAITRSNINAATDFLSLTGAQLSYKAAPGSWNVLECLEHLNRYSQFYLPHISRHLDSDAGLPGPVFKSGWLGNYLVNMVVARDKGKKIKTFSAMDTLGSQIDKTSLTHFLDTQRHLLELLAAAQSANLNRAGIPVTFTKLIQLRLGDALRFMVYHNQRHIFQAQRAIAKS